MYHPKGSLCGNCCRKKENCSKLPFNTFPVYEKYTFEKKEYFVVICKEYKK